MSPWRVRIFVAAMLALAIAPIPSRYALLVAAALYCTIVLPRGKRK